MCIYNMYTCTSTICFGVELKDIQHVHVHACVCTVHVHVPFTLVALEWNWISITPVQLAMLDMSVPYMTIVHACTVYTHVHAHVYTTSMLIFVL